VLFDKLPACRRLRHGPHAKSTTIWQLVGLAFKSNGDASSAAAVF
jgi:hypothetical protein